METKILIAVMLGILFTTVGLGMMLNTKFYIKIVEDLNKHPVLLYTGGLLSLLLGFALLSVESTWQKDWTSMITVLGWLSVIKGIFIVLFPERCIELSNMIKKDTTYFTFAAMLSVLLGVGFLIAGFSSL
jgi:hypothetical protein